MLGPSWQGIATRSALISSGGFESTGGSPHRSRETRTPEERAPSGVSPK